MAAWIAGLCPSTRIHIDLELAQLLPKSLKRGRERRCGAVPEAADPVKFLRPLRLSGERR